LLVPLLLLLTPDNSLNNFLPLLAGEITAQVTITGNAATGKTAYETAQDCIDNGIVSGDGHADGLTIFWNTATFDDGSYEDLLQYYETNYS
jgi:hypothetical protein